MVDNVRFGHNDGCRVWPPSVEPKERNLGAEPRRGVPFHRHRMRSWLQFIAGMRILAGLRNHSVHRIEATLTAE